MFLLIVSFNKEHKNRIYITHTTVFNSTSMIP